MNETIVKYQILLRPVRLVLAAFYLAATIIFPVSVQANYSADQQALADYLAAGGSLADLCLTVDEETGLQHGCDICPLVHYTFEGDQTCHSLLVSFPDEAILFPLLEQAPTHARLEASAAIRAPPLR